jgi:hypothetical protein
MRNKIISLSTEVSCPLCLSKTLNPIVLKNFQRAIDVYFIKHNPKAKSKPSTDSSEISAYNSVDTDNLDLSQKPHFFKCETCASIFRNPEFILPETEEHQRYSTHENNLEDPRYLKYLEESIEPFLSYTSKSEKGLDYGCGPTKGLEYILKPKGYDLESYDKYFYPNPLSINSNFADNQLEGKKFDYLVCHEVIEHFVNFNKELQTVLDLLNPNGKLFIRTELYPQEVNKFEDWYYKNDSTHVFFLSLDTLKYIELSFNIKFKQLDKNKLILIKNKIS